MKQQGQFHRGKDTQGQCFFCLLKDGLLHDEMQKRLGSQEALPAANAFRKQPFTGLHFFHTNSMLANSKYSVTHPVQECEGKEKTKFQ